MHDMLKRIVAHKKEEVKQLKQSAYQRHKKASDKSLPMRNFSQALLQKTPAVIAEIKRASPSRGLICQNFDVVNITKAYAANQASCISVLTDAHFFQGHNDFLPMAKAACTLPVLRKDFIIDEHQITESLLLGADCILLIAAILDNHQLHDFCVQALELNMQVLVESHTEAELERALALPTPLIGINNRNLADFSVDLKRSITLAERIPQDRIIITESGIHSAEDIKHLQAHRIQAFLIGETLMKAADCGAKLREILTI
ncbi:MAG: indole-3-glycerol-phosphate synthase [Legionellaceae bacterium]|nr:indole-3-glycerol-phosphate synthase [Legionellaceae bacterium]HAF87042.1 indole-3-glycerol phosphate synthase TrpC [Legionellales bacterium]HCA89247.1 indole-3-glycerol phosphate synthase TrpC [Legionellales bacterium]|tara:strand:+ start:2321 stop:3097 length:777 start_codon:yes stop_codon:yes gene_type:complete